MTVFKNYLILFLCVFYLIACSGSGVNKKTDINNIDDISVPDELVVEVYSCSDATVHCVDDTSGEFDEFSTIQDAVDRSVPGDVVLVFEGSYTGFKVSNSGTSDKPVKITTNGEAVSIVSGNSQSGNDNIYLSDVNFVTIEGFTVLDANQYGIGSHDASASSPMQSLKIQFNDVSSSSSANIYLSQTENSIILGNKTHNSINSHGIYLSNAGSDNCILQGNVTYNNAKNGIHFNGDSRQGGDGLHKGLLITRNIIFDNVANGVDADGVYDSAFTNNLIYNNGRHGIRVFAEDASGGASNLIFANNSIILNADEAIKLTDDLGNHTFFNNILVDNQGANCIYVENPNVFSGFNIYKDGCQFRAGTASLGAQLFTSSTTLTSTSQALFINSSSENFNLKALSPASGSGSSDFNGVLAPTVNILGASRGSVINIGAY